MSCALSQRISKDTSIIHRLLLGFFVTDEFFGISISRSGKLNPFYTYGAILIGCPCWAFGNLLPLRIVSALSVALFGMFLAIIVPPSRKNKTLLGIVLVSFAASFAFAYLPVINQIDEGTRTIILTIVISAAAALLFPVKEEEENENVA
jgi:predicted branched-subunit amino acid permease